MKRETGFRLRDTGGKSRQRDYLTPIHFAACSTVFFEVLAIIGLHADPDMHPINFVLFGLFVFATVGAAVYDNVNG
ncbi:hypothetical protein [Burkholderia contaminans]|uniref:hypothetical protein n=1 Tax=Burkholderia contaminans TaxID=488447 RepID=UPI003D66A66E